MCRLFGFRSSVPEQVHDSLVTEQNSLRKQSVRHQDGWGIASYAADDGGPPLTAHGLGPAHQDPEFERVSSLVSAATVLAHVRAATVGRVALMNAHPFTHGRWAFAHNGTLRQFASHQEKLEALIHPELRSHLQGETDSERCFYLFLSRLPNQGREAVSLDEAARALAWTARTVCQLTDPRDPDEPRSAFSALVTDGRVMLATRRNRSLFFSERKKRNQAPSEPPAQGTRLRQIVIASEELSGEDHWHELPEETVLGVSEELRLHQWTVAELHPSN